MVTAVDIQRLLCRFGITSSDTVLIHSSMRSIGGVEGGCDGLLDAVCSYLWDGLLLIPSHTWDRVDAAHPVYDVRTTMPCTGALSTVAVERSDGIRSLHPTHSVVAFGRGAADFIRGEERAVSPASPGGVWARLYDVHAKILLIGVGHNRNTFIHAVDEMIDLPHRLTEPVRMTVRDYDGREYTLHCRKHGRTGSANFGNYEQPLSVLGATQTDYLGEAMVICCDAYRTAQVIQHLWSVTDHDLTDGLQTIPEAYYRDFPKA